LPGSGSALEPVWCGFVSSDADVLSGASCELGCCGVVGAVAGFVAAFAGAFGAPFAGAAAAGPSRSTA
jgi:hypothetical protein